LRLDSVRLPADENIEAYVGSGWVDGLLPSSVRKMEINGLPAVVAIARAGEWNFRIAVIRSGEFFYRLIFAARKLSDQADARFMESIKSFRRLGADDSVDARPLHIAVAVAAPGDTIETMSGRMVVPNRPAEYFMLLNGLSPGDVLVPGEHYKIVTE